LADGRPIRIAIDHDDYRAEHVGHTADGRQFFLTTPFEPGTHGNDGQEFVALYLFDAAGRFQEARIDQFGTTFGLIIREPETAFVPILYSGLSD
jgi:hypothetical protein